MEEEFRTFKLCEISDYASLTLPFLREYTASNTVFIGVVEQLLKEGPNAYGDDVLLSTFSRNGKLLFSALQTPPFPLLLSYSEGEMKEEIFNVLSENLNRSVPGVLGGSEDSKCFAQKYCEKNKLKCVLNLKEIVYEIERMNFYNKYDDSLLNDKLSYLSPVKIEEYDVAFKWFFEFLRDVHQDKKEVVDDAPVRVRKTIESGRLFFWRNDNDEEALCMVGFCGETESMARVGPVFTPIQQRGHGYAHSAVTILVHLMFSRFPSFDRVVLIADRDNKTSNGIYQKIGFTSVCSLEEYKFT